MSDLGPRKRKSTSKAEVSPIKDAPKSVKKSRRQSLEEPEINVPEFTAPNSGKKIGRKSISVAPVEEEISSKEQAKAEARAKAKQSAEDELLAKKAAALPKTPSSKEMSPKQTKAVVEEPKVRVGRSATKLPIKTPVEKSPARKSSRVATPILHEDNGEGITPEASPEKSPSTPETTTPANKSYHAIAEDKSCCNTEISCGSGRGLSGPNAEKLTLFLIICAALSLIKKFASEDTWGTTYYYAVNAFIFLLAFQMLKRIF